MDFIRVARKTDKGLESLLAGLRVCGFAGLRVCENVLRRQKASTLTKMSSLGVHEKGHTLHGQLLQLRGCMGGFFRF